MKDMEKLFNNPEESVRTAEHPLTRLLRGMWADEGMTTMKFSDLLNAWLDSPASGVIADKPGHRSTTRGNFLDSVKSNRMSWDMFMRAMQVMNPNGIELSVGVEWTPTHKTIHTINIPFKSLNIETLGVSEAGAVTPVKLNKSRWSGRLTGTKGKPATYMNIEVKDKEKKDE